MKHSPFEADGFAVYADAIRRGSRDPYAAYRLYERSWVVRGKDRNRVLRRAAIVLLESDPWFLATAMPLFLHALQIRDLERLTPFVGAGPASKAAPLLRAVLWYNARKGHYHPDRAGRAQLRRALAFLKQVPVAERNLDWHAMQVGCYRALDFARYKRAFAKLHALTEPSDRAFDLNDFLGVVAGKRDWRTYDRFRVQWDQLPPDHHGCQCYTNQVHTLDGLRAVVAKRWSTIPASLEKAAAVRGCPHLNSGGLSLELVRILIARRKHLDACRTYLERASHFGQPGCHKRIADLRRKLDRATKSSAGRVAPGRAMPGRPRMRS